MNAINPTQWREVAQDEFYRGIGQQNVHPSIQPGPYPYTAVFQTPDKQARGKTVGYYPDGSRIVLTRYYLPNT